MRVPCSTSNLGPGFDLLGLALGRFVDVRARVQPGAEEGGARHRVVHRGVAPDPAVKDLLSVALRAFAERFGGELPSLELEVDSAIPVGRGFGSSGAAVAAGLLVAAAAAGRDDLLADRAGGLAPLAAELEGHPDNSTASLLGGCTLACPVGDAGRLRVVQHPVHPDLAFALAWPEAPLFTPEARAVLPREVPFADAVENPRRLALLLEGLRTGDGGLLGDGIVDRLHERFRRTLVPGADAAVRAAMDAGAHAACLSGAGSGMVAIAPRERVEAVARALAAPLTRAQCAVVEVARTPPTIRVVG